MAQVSIDTNALAVAMATALAQVLGSGTLGNVVSGGGKASEVASEEKKSGEEVRAGGETAAVVETTGAVWSDDVEETVASDNANLDGGPSGDGSEGGRQQGRVASLSGGGNANQDASRVEGTTGTDGVQPSGGAANVEQRVRAVALKPARDLAGDPPKGPAADRGGASWAQVARGGDDSSSSSESGKSFVYTKEGFMAMYVRVPDVEAVADTLAKLCGHKVGKSGRPDLALVRYTAATVPSAFSNGRDRLRRLAQVGDAAITAAVMVMAFRTGVTLEVMQQLRTRRLTDKYMQERFAKSPLATHMVLAGDVSLADSKTGATALEAFAGVLDLYATKDALTRFCVALGLAKPLFSSTAGSDAGQTESLLDI